jgi:predicted transcriptional regulator
MAGVRTRGRGELEAAILTVLRAHDEPVGAAQIQEEILGDEPAYTTVLTALERLTEKGEVVRSGDSPRKQRFAATFTAAESASRTMVDALSQNEDRRAVLLKFVGDLSETDADLLRSALAPRKR